MARGTWTRQDAGFGQMEYTYAIGGVEVGIVYHGGKAGYTWTASVKGGASWDTNSLADAKTQVAAIADTRADEYGFAGVRPTPTAAAIVTFDTLIAAMLDILPDATLGEDNDGQIVVYTNKRQDASGRLVEFVSD